ncbi:MAG: dTDP-4-dehydrorhamnose 3,5-epimerase [Bacteroidia bacterium]|nr:dTDP-4-dehydrorhamnose 3,5-epimerase [Bacteroidia bacterium]
MDIKTTPIEGLLIIEPQVFTDPRGYFYESYNKEKFVAAGINIEFVQDNQSLSQKGIVRGLHFQAPPFDQGKLVRVIQGAVLDVAVDIRKKSPTYGQNFSIELSAQNRTMFYIPPGFAHGFETLEDNTIFLYKCTDVYNKQREGGLLWNDAELGIKWQSSDPLISEKDKILPLFKDLVSPF